MDNLKKGSAVRYNWQGSPVYGRVESVVTSGIVRDSTGSASMDATEDNPVVRVRLFEDGERTDQIVLRRMSALTRIDSIPGGKADGGKVSSLLSQSEVNYTTLSTRSGQACANCRWFSMTPDGWCRIVANYPKDLMNTGWCSRWEAMPEQRTDSILDDLLTATEMDDDMEDQRAYNKPDDKMDDENEEMEMGEDGKPRKKPKPGTSKPGKSIFDAVKAFFGINDFDGTAFKVVDNRWLAVWSNNFEDLEGEFFPQKAIDDYVARVDMRLIPPPELWFWHEPSTKAGRAEWVGRHGHFLLSMGTFDDTTEGRALKAYAQRTGTKLSMSHGFTYPPEHYKDRQYKRFNTFEITVLPRGKEANPYTTFEGVKAMTLSDDKRRALVDVFGESILAKLDESGKALEAISTAYKDFSPVGDTTPIVSESKEAAAYKALLPDLIDGQNEVLTMAGKAMQEIKALREQIAAQNAVIAGMKEQLDATPKSASRALETQIDPSTLSEDAKKNLMTRDPFWGTEVSGLENS